MSIRSSLSGALPVHGRLSSAMTSSDQPELERNWTFVSGHRPAWMKTARWKILVRHSGLFPAHRVLKLGGGKGPWALYFVYAPEGELDYRHRFCIDRLRAQGFSLLVVVSGLTRAAAIDALGPVADVLIWKALPGFDFSAYSVGLWWLARHAGGSDVLVLNDSVFGPFGDVAAMLRRAPWRLTGFTGSGVLENHLQSYAFMVRNVTTELMMRLCSVFNTVIAFNRFEDVVRCQETRLGRLAASVDSAGALWFSPSGDPTTAWTFELLSEGFPFIKRSLLGKSLGLQPEVDVRAALHARGFDPN